LFGGMFFHGKIYGHTRLQKNEHEQIVRDKIGFQNVLIEIMILEDHTSISNNPFYAPKELDYVYPNKI
jgi:hypothetical protein